ncbi:MAG: YqaJ viral recombinase family protein [Acidimicrobiales bacterium]
MSAVTATSARTDWLGWRRQGIGASDVPAILGLSKWASPWSVWAEKVGLLPLDDTQSDYAEFGHYAEAMVGPWFQDRTGLFVAGEQMQMEHPLEEWRRCTVDGLVFESPNAETHHVDMALGLHQIKTRGPGRRWEEIPLDIAAQEQWEMHVSGLPRAWVSVLHGRRLAIYELERDQADIDFIVGKVGAFWHDHVLAGIPPELDGHDATLAALAAIYPEATPKSSVAIDDVAGALPMLREAKAARKAAEEHEQAAAAVIRWAMKDAYEGTLSGRRAVTLGSQTRKTTCRHCGEVDESAPFRVLRPAKEFA